MDRITGHVFNKLNWTHYSITVLSAISAYIHLVFGLRIGFETLGISFILASVGFMIGSIMILSDYQRKKVYLLGIPFVLGQIILWIWLNSISLSMIPAGIGSLETIDKTAQILILVLLPYMLHVES